MPYPIVRPPRKSLYSQTHCALISHFLHALWAFQQLSMVAAAILLPTFASCVISLLLILPSSKLPGTRGQKLHMGNNLTNHLSGSPARTPTRKLIQLLMLGLQPRGMSAKQQVWGPRAHTLSSSILPKRIKGKMLDKG